MCLRLFLVLLGTVVVVAQTTLPIKNGKLTTPLNANNLAITNLAAESVYGTNLVTGTIPSTAMDALTDAAYRAVTVNTNEFYVTTYGTNTGTGDADNDTYAIQAAVNAASLAGGGVVRFPTRLYYATTDSAGACIYLSNNVSLRGDNATIKMADGAAHGSAIIQCVGVTNLTIEGLILDGNWAWRKTNADPDWEGSIDFEDNGINLRATNIIIRDVKFRDIGKDGINNDIAKNILVDFCEFDRCGDAGLASDAIGVIVSRSQFINNGWELMENGTHVGGIGDVDSSDMIVNQCRFTNNWQGLFKQSGQRYILSDNIFSSTNGGRTNIVLIASGDALITKNLFWNGVGIHFRTNETAYGGAGITCLDFSIKGNRFHTHRGIVADTYLNRTTISDNDFVSSDVTAGVAQGAGIALKYTVSGGVKVLNNWFQVGTSAITLQAGAPGVRFIGNVTTTGGSGYDFYNQGSAGSHVIEDNKFLNTSPAYYNIGLENATNCTLINNTCLRDITLSSSNNVVLRNTLNRFYLYTAGARNNTVQGNTVELIAASHITLIETNIVEGVSTNYVTNLYAGGLTNNYFANNHTLTNGSPWGTNTGTIYMPLEPFTVGSIPLSGLDTNGTLSATTVEADNFNVGALRATNAVFLTSEDGSTNADFTGIEPEFPNGLNAGGNIFTTGAFNGNAVNLTNLPAAQLTGVFPAIPGNGGGLTNLNPAAMTNTVTAFGATGDGVTDDIDAIQLAVDSLTNNGGTVYFPPGTYSISRPIVVRTVPSTYTYSFHLVGDGGSKSRIVVADTSTPAIILDSVKWSEIKDIGFFNPSTSTTNAIVLTNMCIHNLFEGLQVGHWATGFFFAGHPTLTSAQYGNQLVRSHFYNNDTGIGGNDQSSGMTQIGPSCEIAFNRVGVDLNGINTTITESAIEANNIGIQLRPTNSASITTVNVVKNHFEGNTNTDIFVTGEASQVVYNLNVYENHFNSSASDFCITNGGVKISGLHWFRNYHSTYPLVAIGALQNSSTSSGLLPGWHIHDEVLTTAYWKFGALKPVSSSDLTTLGMGTTNLALPFTLTVGHADYTGTAVGPDVDSQLWLGSPTNRWLALWANSIHSGESKYLRMTGAYGATLTSPNTVLLQGAPVAISGNVFASNAIVSSGTVYANALSITNNATIGGTVYANAGSFTNQVLVSGFDIRTNLFTINGPIYMGTNWTYTGGAATWGVTGVGGTIGAEERYSRLTLKAEGNITFTNPAAFFCNDFSDSRTITNGNMAIISVSVMPGFATNMSVLQLR